jgi:hypothetical protein
MEGLVVASSVPSGIFAVVVEGDAAVWLALAGQDRPDFPQHTSMFGMQMAHVAVV